MNVLQSDDRFKRLTERWSESDRYAHHSVLKRALLRELRRLLHDKRSSLLSTGKSVPKQIGEWEQRLEVLREAELPNQTELKTLLTDKRSPSPGRFAWQEKWNQAIEPGKLERYDRTWEKILLQEALSSGWSLWTLKGQVSLRDVEKANQGVSDSVWPQGILLFVENVAFHAAHGLWAHPVWEGKWSLLFSPEADQPTRFPASSLPACLTHLQWNRLFPLTQP